MRRSLQSLKADWQLCERTLSLSRRQATMRPPPGVTPMQRRLASPSHSAAISLSPWPGGHPRRPCRHGQSLSHGSADRRAGAGLRVTWGRAAPPRWSRNRRHVRWPRPRARSRRGRPVEPRVDSFPLAEPSQCGQLRRVLPVASRPGTGAPSRQVLDGPTAMACTGSATPLLDPPDRNVPRFVSWVALHFLPTSSRCRAVRLMASSLRCKSSADVDGR